jgi:hypothetical protein
MKGRRRNAANSRRKGRRAGTKAEQTRSSRSLPGLAHPTVPVPPSFQPLVAAFSHERAVTLEKGWGSDNAVLKVRGKIFAMTMGADLVLKLPWTRVDELVDSAAGARFDPRRDGRVMKEWVVLRPGAADALDLAGEAHQFVEGAVK